MNEAAAARAAPAEAAGPPVDSTDSENWIEVGLSVDSGFGVELVGSEIDFGIKAKIITRIWIVIGIEVEVVRKQIEPVGLVEKQVRIVGLVWKEFEIVRIKVEVVGTAWLQTLKGNGKYSQSWAKMHFYFKIDCQYSNFITVRSSYYFN